MEDYDKVNLLDEVVITATRPKHNFKSCVEGGRYISDLILGKSGATTNLYNVRGNAWDLANTSFGKTYDATTDFNYNVGDIVIFDRPSFPSDRKRGIPTEKQHMGVISGFDNSGNPMVTHLVGSADKYFKYEPLNNTTLKSGVTYKPNKVIRLNRDSDLNFPKIELDSIPNNESYGVNLNNAIIKLNELNKPEFDLTKNEEVNLKLATLGLLGLESEFGGSKRFAVRSTFPEVVNLGKQLYREKSEVPSVGYGSIKPEFVYLNTSYPDLKEKLDKKEISKSEYYNQTSERTADLRNWTNYTGVIPALGYNFWFNNKYNPETNPSYTSLMLHWGGFDTRKVGLNIEDDTALIYGHLVGLHKKYPEKSIEELIKLYKGGLNESEKIKFDKIIQQAQTGNIDQSFGNKLILLYTRGLDKVKGVSRDMKLNVVKNVTPGIHLKAAMADFVLDDQDIDNSFLSDSEYSALVDVVKQALAGDKRLLGYTTDDKYQAYTPEGVKLSGGDRGFDATIKNLTDPYTKLLNFLGQARIIEDDDNYYVVDEYDFNNYGRLQNPYQGIVRNPTPYAAVRSFGTTVGSAPGTGRKVKITIPKSELQPNIKLKYINNF